MLIRVEETVVQGWAVGGERQFTGKKIYRLRVLDSILCSERPECTRTVRVLVQYRYYEY